MVLTLLCHRKSQPGSLSRARIRTTRGFATSSGVELDHFLADPQSPDASLPFMGLDPSTFGPDPRSRGRLFATEEDRRYWSLQVASSIKGRSSSSTLRHISSDSSVLDGSSTA